ncbi:MAG: peroxiredoxin [Bdellovibrionota bacterium]
MVKVGDLLPYFSLYNQNNKIRRNDDYLGKWIVLFIYPKDDTPGCTLEATGFSAKQGEFDRLNAKVVGLSNDDVASHDSFCQKHKLMVELLSDPQEKLLKELDFGQKEWQGKLYWNRTTLIINDKGAVRYVYENVTPDGHEKEVLSRLHKLQEENH